MKQDFDADEALGFEPAVSVTGSDPVDVTRTRPGSARPGKAKRSMGSALRRRLTAGAVLVGALIAMGGSYAAFATSSGATDSTATSAQVGAGKQLYEVSCITCHGANLQGVANRGPALINVGSAAVYFQVSTGRMPLKGQGAEALRKTAVFSEAQIDELGAYIESIGGGPQLPGGSLRSSDIAAGGQLFRLNCASCHGATGKGAPLSAGKVAPGLNDATDKQIVAAMLSGPESMPIFSNNQLSLVQKTEIVSYIQTLKASKDPGGNGIDRIGPVSEALVIWVGGVGAVMIAILWIGAKAQ